VIRFPAMTEVHTESGLTQSRSEGLSHGENRAGCEADHISPITA
jgi:hypothetical protein